MDNREILHSMFDEMLELSDAVCRKQTIGAARQGKKATDALVALAGALHNRFVAAMEASDGK